MYASTAVLLAVPIFLYLLKMKTVRMTKYTGENPHEVSTYCWVSVWRLRVLSIFWVMAVPLALTFLVCSFIKRPMYEEDRPKFTYEVLKWIQIIPVYTMFIIYQAISLMEDSAIYFMICAQKGFDADQLLYDIENPPIMPTVQDDSVFG